MNETRSEWESVVSSSSGTGAELQPTLSLVCSCQKSDMLQQIYSDIIFFFPKRTRTHCSCVFWSKLNPAKHGTNNKDSMDTPVINQRLVYNK